MNIGEVIKCRRLKRNITQAELAQQLNVTPQAVSRWEMGVSYPDIVMVPRISEVLGTSADELLGIRPCGAECTGAEGRLGAGECAVLSQSQVDSIYDYEPVSATGERRRILVADDADFMRMILENILTQHGHTVLQAENGQECLDVLEREAVDVCVLDIVMPGMHGIEVLQKIKERKPEVRVVMLSALSTEDNVKQALQLGAEAFVAKPFQEGCLLERIG